ncbi:helix-turn-helix domain-containing protein [Streptomyces sp. NPDC012794]|uniref:helix-turn-helix domain-containing protein n=1 Tax=Streptomyces sp. NPDC012794 TaxID=3364850 RepID=UPI003673A8E6
MGVNDNPTVSRRRQGSELRRLRQTSGMTTRQVAERLLISQPKISLLENGRRLVKPRDVRDLCRLYAVQDTRLVDDPMRLARPSPASRYGCDASAGWPPGNPLRLWAVLDEAALRRVVGSREVMREQVEHLNSLGAQPHVTVQVLPHEVGAHPGVSGQFSLLEFSDATDVSVVDLERFTSDLYLEKQSDVHLFGDMYAHLQVQALSPDSTREFPAEVVKTYVGTEFRAAP